MPRAAEPFIGVWPAVSVPIFAEIGMGKWRARQTPTDKFLWEAPRERGKYTFPKFAA